MCPPRLERRAAAARAAAAARDAARVATAAAPATASAKERYARWLEKWKAAVDPVAAGPAAAEGLPPDLPDLVPIPPEDLQPPEEIDLVDIMLSNPIFSENPEWERPQRN